MQCASNDHGRVQKSAKKKFDTVHDPNEPFMKQYPEYLTGNNIVMIWNVTGMKQGLDGKNIKASEFKNSVLTTYPHCVRLTHVLSPTERPPEPFHKIEGIGFFPFTHCYPAGIIFNAQKYLTTGERQKQWSSITDPRFVPTPALIAKLITQLTECLFQAPYQIDIGNVLPEGDPAGIVQGP